MQAGLLGSQGPSHPVSQAAAKLVRDAECARVVGALEAEGQEVVVLKGPSVAAWLYDPAYERAYTDIDILVDPGAVDEVERTLREKGYRRLGVELPMDRPWYARSYMGASGCPVEVHRTLPGVGVSPADAWSTLSGRTVSMEVGGRGVRVFDETARLMHVVLHAWHHAGAVAHIGEDLRRARENVRDEVWRDANRLASALKADEAFVAGLAMIPGASPVVDLTGTRGALPDPILDAARWFGDLRGFRQKVRYLAAKMFPPPDFMRTWSPMADRTRAGLALAYVGRPFWVMARGIRGFLSMRSTNR